MLSKNKHKIFIIATVTCLYVIVLLKNNGCYPVFIDDCLTQHTPFLLSDNFGFDLIGYNTFFFLGASDISVSGFSFGTNPLVFVLKPLLKLLDSYAFFFLNYVSTIVAIFTFDLWLSDRIKNYIPRTISIMIIIFSGWFMGLYKYQFVSALWTLPLVLYAVDKYLENKKGILLSVFVCLASITNYYFLIIITPLTFLYTLFTELYFYKESSIKIFITKAMIFFFYYALGIGISGLVFIPSIISITSMPRNSSMPLTRILNIKEIFRLVSGLINPINAANDHNFLISSVDFGDSWLTYGGGPLIYSLLITLFILPEAIKKLDKKYCIVGLYLFLFVLTFFKGLYPLLNATWDSRWMLMIVVFNALFVGMTLDLNIKFDNKSSIGKGLIIELLIILCFIVSYKLSLYSEGALKIIVLILLIQSVIVFLYVLFINNRKVLLAIVTFEAFVSFITPFSFMDKKSISSSLITKEAYYDIYGVAKDISEFLNSRDSSFYRVNEMFQDLDCSNNGLAYGYRAFTLYSSLYNTSIENYANGRFKGYGQWHFTPNKGLFELKDLLGSKYLVTYKDTIMIPYGYKLIGEINGNKIYENANPISLGYAVDCTLSKTVYDTLSEFDKTRALVNTIILEDSTNNTFEDDLLLLAKDEFGETPIDVSELGEGIIYVKENTDYNLLFTRKYELYKGSELVEAHESRTDFPLELYIPEDITTVYLFNSTEDSIGYNITYDVFFNDMSNYEEKISNIVDEELTNILIKNNKIEGDISVNNDKWVVITLAYDKGFKAFDNGKEIDIYNVNDGLIGLKLNKGDHHIVLKYQTQGLKEGFIVSIICVATAVTLYYLNKKKRV